MAISKNEEYTEDEQLTAQFAKAMAHPARISILKILSKQNSCFCGEIVDILPIAQATVSQHLKELKNAGLIQGCIEPPKIKYCINYDNWIKAQKLFNKLFENEGESL